MSPSLPTDAPQRHLISEDGLDRTLFVEAGAGTGKTTQLVQRVVNTVLAHDHISLADIAAITFTEAAASELQSRIRVAFEQRLADPDISLQHRARCEQAIDDADLAAISTVHGFASRILGQYTVAAGLPPRVTVLDEVSSQLAHEHRWERFVDRIHADPSLHELLYRAALLDVPLSPRYHGQGSFKDVAANFAQNWDRLESMAADLGDLADIDFSPFERAVAALEAVAAECHDPSDLLVRHLHDVCLPEMRALAAIDDPHRKLRHLASRSWRRGTGGKKASWPRPIMDVKDDIEAVNQAVKEVVGTVSASVVDQLMRLTAAEVLDAAHTRQRDGGLEFHDLLVLARDLLRHNAEVRSQLHQRFRHILLDEFQDTDPIQIELASLIATSAPEPGEGGWQDHVVEPGRLFFVGDPKQSIYRFRRADIKLFLSARDVYGGTDAIRLGTNFRTVAPIIDWVNAVFDEAMPEEVDGAQPRYEPLSAHRSADSGADHRPLVLGGAHPDPKVRASTLREAEAADVSDVIGDIAAHPERWPVHDEATGAWRPARLADVTILIPTRTSLPYLRDALEQGDIPYRLATGTLVYDTQEVRDALSVLRAVDDPNDTLSLVAALRSPLYGCSDIDLYTYHRAEGRWDLRRRRPDGIDADHPVAVALEHLRVLWSQRWWVAPSTMLDRVLRDRHAYLLGFGSHRPDDVWRRLRFLVDQARLFEESNGSDLRSFLAWADLQSADGARVHEPLLPETDDDAVQILTVHGAKGLEFPITILSGLTTARGGQRPGVSVLWGTDGVPEVKLRGDLATAAHKPRADLEEEMDDYEKLRLLYVAATRARDHLVVSGHHKVVADPAKTFATRLSLFHERHDDLSRAWVGPHPSTEPVASVPVSRVEAQPVPDVDDSAAPERIERSAWIARRRALLAPGFVPTTASATAIARTVDASVPDSDADDASSGPGIADADADGPDRPLVRRRGRAGSAIGRAVHATLEIVDFDQPGALRALVERQCDAEAVPDAADTVEALVRSALASDAIALARQHRVHRELYVGAPIADGDEPLSIEGYVDLLIVTPAGLVIVDYKTDTAASPAEIDAKLLAYELQGAAYAVALEASTGLTVVDCRFVFCKVNGAIERSVHDLPGAKQRVRDAARSLRTTGHAVAQS